MNECPSFRATNACSDRLPPTGIDYGNGLTFCVTNARIICRSKNGHCHIWTVAEGKMMAGILIVYIRVIISWEITCVIFNLGGMSASIAFFDALDVELGTLSPAHRAFVRVEKAGTHVSNFGGMSGWLSPILSSPVRPSILLLLSHRVWDRRCLLRGGVGAACRPPRPNPRQGPPPLQRTNAPSTRSIRTCAARRVRSSPQSSHRRIPPPLPVNLSKLGSHLLLVLGA